MSKRVPEASSSRHDAELIPPLRPQVALGQLQSIAATALSTPRSATQLRLSQQTDAGNSSRLQPMFAPRLSLPPPQPPTAATPPAASKRPRFSDPTYAAANGSSPSAKPLSQMAMPLPMSSLPSPSRNVASPHTTPMRPLHQPSIQEFQRLVPPEVLAPLPPPLSARERYRLSMETNVLSGPRSPATEEPVAIFQEVTWRQKRLLTGFKSLDEELERIDYAIKLGNRRQTQSDDENDAQGSADDAITDLGLPSGSMVEIAGPPGSGKSKFCVQMSVTERLRSLLQARFSMSDARLNDSSDVTIFEHTPSHDRQTIFAEEFWDAEIVNADQVLLIDCEGAMVAEIISDAAWIQVTGLWAKHGHNTEILDRSNAPEVVRRLVAAILSGIHVCRVTSILELVALLTALRSTDNFDELQKQSSSFTPLPPRTSLIVLDSLSHHLRVNGGSSKDRKQATYVYETVQRALLRLQQPFQRQVEETDSDIRTSTAALCPTIVFTNQLSARRSKADGPATQASTRLGSRSNKAEYKEGGAILAPQLQGQPLNTQQRSHDRRVAPSVAFSGPEIWDDDDSTLALAATRSRTDVHLGHDRGWAPSFLGPEVWRLLLFRHGSFGHRAAQVVSIPATTQSDLNAIWEAAKSSTEPLSSMAEETGSTSANVNGTSAAQELSSTLAHIRQSLFRWRPFLVDSSGLTEGSSSQWLT